MVDVAILVLIEMSINVWYGNVGRITSTPRLEIGELKDFITEMVIERAGWQLMSAHDYRENINSPYHKVQANKKLSNAYKLLHLAKPTVIGDIIELARRHFDENNRHRTLTILFANIPSKKIYGIRENIYQWKFNYYFMIRIRKVRVNGYRAFRATLGSFCPFGQVVHYIVRDSEKTSTPLGDPWFNFEKAKGNPYIQPKPSST